MVNLSALLLLVLAIGANFYSFIGWIIPIALIIVWLTITVFGVFQIRLNYFINGVNHISTSKKVVAITFDDGPHENTVKVLDLLKQYNAKASFFVKGINCENFPDVLKKIDHEGHEVGNHTYSHKSTFPFYKLKKQKEELSKTSIIIKRHIGKTISTFRPPFGITNPRIAKVLKELNLKQIGWSVRSLDTVSKNAKQIVKRVIRKASPGCIILMHEYPKFTVSALEQILQELSAQGYKFITVGQLIKENEK